MKGEKDMSLYSNLVIAIPHSVGEVMDVDWALDKQVAAFRDRYSF